MSIKMSEGIQMSEVDTVTNVLIGEVGDLTPSTPSGPSIFKVDRHLRGEWNVYDPIILAVGPYHHRNAGLKDMEKFKYEYLKRLLRRKSSPERYVAALAPVKRQARECYAKDINLNDIDFIKLLILDGFFIIELLRYFSLKSSRDADDPIFRTERTLSLLRQDIFLLENQLPFFVLCHLFNMTKTEEDCEDLISLVLHFADKMFLNLSVSSRVTEGVFFKNSFHLCGLIHDALCFPAPWYDCKRKEGENWDDIDSAARLREAGIKIKNVKENDSFMDISFVDGVLRIPQLSIFDETESQLRNMETYEQYLPDGEPKYVSDYICFMYRLVNTSNDVKLLRSCGVIKNWSGDDEKVRVMFSKLGRHILTSSHFSYSRVFYDVNSHCQRKNWTVNLCCVGLTSTHPDQ